MKAPKVQLKNVKLFRAHEGMTGMSADIWVNGVKCLYVFDDAMGGMFDYTSYAYNSKDPDRVKENLAILNDYVKTLPEKEIEMSGKTTTYKPDLDDFVNDLLLAHEQKKQENKVKRLMKKAIVFGVPGGNTYRYFNFKKDLSTFPAELVQKYVDKAKEACKDGEVILNTNLEQFGVKA